MKISKAYSCILYVKNDDGELEFMISIHVDDMFMAERPGKLKKTKEMMKLDFNIQESGKVKKFIGVYYEWGHGKKVLYAKMTLEKDVNKLVEYYKKLIGGEVKVQNTPGAPCTTHSKI